MAMNNRGYSFAFRKFQDDKSRGGIVHMQDRPAARFNNFFPGALMGTSKNVKFPLAYHTPPKNQGDFAKKCMNLS